MKFSEHLQAHLTPEWRTQYIQYENLKVFIIDCVAEAEKEGKPSPDCYTAYDDVFFMHCAKELEKINNFYSEKLAEAKRKFIGLTEELSVYEERAIKSRLNLHISTDFIRKMSLKSPPSSPTVRSFQSKSVYVSDTPNGDDSQILPVLKDRIINVRVNENSVVRPSSNADQEGVGGESMISLQAYMRRRNSFVGEETNASVKLSRHSSRKESSGNHQPQHGEARSQQRKKKRWQSEEKRHVKNLHAIKLGFSEFYLSLILLQNYQTLNFTGFRKILKKHDKLFHSSSGQKWRVDNVDSAQFYSDKTVDEMIVKVENLYTDHLEHGDRPKAMKRLRVPPLAEQQNPLKTFRIGFLNGVLLVQLVVLLLTAYFFQTVDVPYAEWKLFRAPLVIGIFIMLIGINIYVWRSSGVNYVLIFEIDPRDHVTHLEMLELGSGILVLCSSCVLYTLYSPLIHAPALVGPLVLNGFLALYFFNPLPCIQYKARRWLWHVLKRIFLAPFYPVKFADFWLADQLNSLAPLFVDVPFVMCFYLKDVDWRNFEVKHSIQKNFSLSIEESLLETHLECSTAIWHSHLSRVLLALPAWFRFAQCCRRFYDMPKKTAFPHLANAGKYSTNFLVVFCGILSVMNPNNVYYFILQAAAFLISTCYTLYWDIYLDWGLLRSKAEGSYLLRDQLVYRYVWSYYLAVVENVILRFAWIFRLTASAYNWEYEAQMRYGLVITEVVRRFIWNFFRLENEHLNNVGQFRAVRDICIKPLPPRSHMTNGGMSGDKLPDDKNPSYHGAVRGILRKPVQVISSMARQASQALLDSTGATGLFSRSSTSHSPINSNKSSSRRHTYANIKSLHPNGEKSQNMSDKVVSEEHLLDLSNISEKRELTFPSLEVDELKSENKCQWQLSSSQFDVNDENAMENAQDKRSVSSLEMDVTTHLMSPDSDSIPMIVISPSGESDAPHTIPLSHRDLV